MKDGTQDCWICGSSNMALAKPSDITSAVDSQSFAITDSNYGTTGELHKCADCGFLQCADLNNVVGFYEDLEDREYDSGRKERGIQARKILEQLRPYRSGGRLLDIGAGSGILVEQAQALGFDAEGVEPSRWLQQRAMEEGLKVHLGTYPHPEVRPGFDLITVVDVIEHVSTPVALMRDVAAQLNDDGFGIVVTPDRDTLVPRLMGWKWWHYRIAHIGYFNKANLLLALDRAGLEPVKSGRPCWYFSVGYLAERLYKYLPGFLRLRVPGGMAGMTVPLNLGDSLYVIFRKKGVPR